ncbi:hypothetical protein LINGRAHAP2_LOCUS35680 [Linum grandiflorum]
MLDRD